MGTGGGSVDIQPHSPHMWLRLEGWPYPTPVEGSPGRDPPRYARQAVFSEQGTWQALGNVCKEMFLPAPWWHLSSNQQTYVGHLVLGMGGR